MNSTKKIGRISKVNSIASMKNDLYYEIEITIKGEDGLDYSKLFKIFYSKDKIPCFFIDFCSSYQVYFPYEYLHDSTILASLLEDQVLGKKIIFSITKLPSSTLVSFPILTENSMLLHESTQDYHVR